MHHLQITEMQANCMKDVHKISWKRNSMKYIILVYLVEKSTISKLILH